MLERSFLTRLRHLAKKIPGIGKIYFNSRLALVPTYREDGLCTVHSADFLGDSEFRDAYNAGLTMQPGTEMRWRSHVAIWAAHQASLLDGDFGECGVNRAFLSTAIMHALDFKNRIDKQFYLFDTFCGLVPEQVTEEDTAARWNEYPDVYEYVRTAFADYQNVHVIKGVVPKVLEQHQIDAVAYLSVDMNCAAPEVAAMEHFWPRMVPGGMILIDDYGWSGHEAQKRGADAFASSVGARILSLPTGQGLLIKHEQRSTKSSAEVVSNRKASAG